MRVTVQHDNMEMYVCSEAPDKRTVGRTFRAVGSRKWGAPAVLKPWVRHWNRTGGIEQVLPGKNDWYSKLEQHNVYCLMW
jgi:hypothetical protein